MSNTGQTSDARHALLRRYLASQAMRQRAVATSAIARREPLGHAPLMLTQEPIWRRAQTPGIPPLYNETFTIHRIGPVDVATLQRTLTEIVRRHEAWRTTFAAVDGELRQFVQPPPEAVPLPYADLRHVPEALREAEALRLATDDGQQPFDLASGPLFRARLSRLADEKYWLSMAVHQIIIDGVSLYRVLPAEIAELYDAFSSGREPQLPELPIQCADFAHWQREWLRGEVLERQLDYWRTQLDGASGALNWPIARPRPPVQTFRGQILPFTFSRETVDGLRNVSKRHGVTLFSALAAGFAMLMHRYSGQQDIILGTLAPAGRKRSETQDLLGYFLNPLPLRLQVADGQNIGDLLRQVREVVSGALSHDDVPFETIVEHLRPAPDPSRNPYFQVAITLDPVLPELPGWSLTPMDVQTGGARWDLYLELDDRPGGMLGRAQYNPDLFEAVEIKGMLLEYEQILNRMSAAADGGLVPHNCPPLADVGSLAK